MKRVRAFFITSVFLALLWCYADYHAELENMIAPSTQEEQETKTESEQAETIGTVLDSETVADTSTEQSDATSIEPTESAPPPTPVQTNQPSPDAKDYGTYDSIEFTEVEEVAPTETEQITTEIVSASAHKNLGEAVYYQYAGLNASEKVVYQTIVDAIKATKNVVDIRTYRCSKDTVTKVYECVVADYPQFFYLAKSYYYTYNAGSQTVNQLILRYSDGATEDAFDDKGNLTVQASRERIEQQIKAFNEKIEIIIQNIPVNVSQLEKEKRIYDYLQANIVYDTEAAKLATGEYNGVVPHAYNAYGAAIEGNAVCEGYGELFQYLCYCVGMNATQVYGSSLGGAHMWNTVCIDNEWYMLDVTWDDSRTEGLYLYNYFNLTTSQMGTDHTIQADSIRVPNCNSTTYAFYNHYAMYVGDSMVAPENYSSVLDYLATSTDKYLCVYIGTQAINVREYLSKHILTKTSDVQQYIKTKNYTIVLSNSFYQVGNYCYIPLK